MIKQKRGHSTFLSLSNILGAGKTRGQGFCWHSLAREWRRVSLAGMCRKALRSASFWAAFISRAHRVGFGTGLSESSPAGSSAACGLGLVAGHVRLHRQLFVAVRINPHYSRRAESVAFSKYICRSCDKDSIEYQANRLASCLLMPREMLKRTWHEWRDEMDPIFLPDLRAANGGYNRNELTQFDAIRQQKINLKALSYNASQPKTGASMPCN
jgi:hypothetical protein